MTNLEKHTSLCGIFDDVTYLTTNAKYVTDHWERWDNTKGATLIKIEHFIDSYCDAGIGNDYWILPNDYLVMVMMVHILRIRWFPYWRGCKV